MESTWCYVVFGSDLRNLHRDRELWGKSVKFASRVFLTHRRRKRGERSSTELVEVMSSAEDNEPVDRPVEWPCTDVHEGVVDHSKEEATTKEVSRPTEMPELNRELALCSFA